jgi:activator of HSP90 ATPase
MTQTIRQTIKFKASPARVFETLISSKRHAAFTGFPATLSRKAGGAFTCYDGYISGFNLQVVPAKRIVQAWRSQGWPDGHFSVVTFAISKSAGGATKLSFTQIGVPAGDVKAKTKGWKFHYWDRLKAHLEG